MKLAWHHLAHFTEIPSDLDGNTSAGVYLWGFKIDEAFVPYYVGKARNVPWRLTEHLSRILGGEYTVYKTEDLAEFWKHEPIYGQISIAKKLVFFRDRRSALRTELADHVDAMVDAFHFTWASIPPDEFRDRAGAAERAVIAHIGPDRLINQRLGDPDPGMDLGNLDEVLGRS